jgi:hypothetical protein
MYNSVVIKEVPVLMPESPLSEVTAITTGIGKVEKNVCKRPSNTYRDGKIIDHTDWQSD